MRARGLVMIAALMCARPAASDPTTVSAPAEPDPRGPAILAMVPADALAFVGIDLASARASPALTAAVTRIVRATGLDDRAIGAAGSLVIAGVPGARVPMVSARSAGAHDVLAFGAIWLDTRTRQTLAQTLPDLGGIQWVAGTLARSPSGFTLSGSAAFADPYVAARIAVSIGMGRKVVTSQLPASVAIAIDKLAVTAMGAQVRISATWSEADLAALATP